MFTSLHFVLFTIMLVDACICTRGLVVKASGGIYLVCHLDPLLLLITPDDFFRHKDSIFASYITHNVQQTTEPSFGFCIFFLGDNAL